jgi:hypothetical protein
VDISASPDELANAKPDLLCQHVGEQAIGCNVKWQTEKHISRTLIELAAEFAVRDKELD